MMPTLVPYAAPERMKRNHWQGRFSLSAFHTVAVMAGDLGYPTVLDSRASASRRFFGV